MEPVIIRPLHFGLFGDWDPRKELWAGISFYMGDRAKWLPAYEKVAGWLGDNNSRGLICVGTCGLGKSLICMKVLPVLFKKHFGIEPMAVTAVDMNRRIDELLSYCGQDRIVIVDDLGTEAAETVTYGNRRRPFCELADRAETTGTLLIITTNLRTTRHATMPYPSIEERYGIPTLDRLRAVTSVVVFKGESLRK